MPLYEQISPELLDDVMKNGAAIMQTGQNFIDPVAAQINELLNSTTIGASGAVFGILLAFGMLFPNTMLYIYFAIPIKAKWFVVLYGAAELFSGIANNSQDNVAHFAHLGGMLFGFILIKYWQKSNKTFYWSMSNPIIEDIVLPDGHLKGGRHIRFKNMPLANLHLTLLEQFGVRRDQIGDSTGRVDARILLL